jgi:hypothetical protein
MMILVIFALVAIPALFAAAALEWGVDSRDQSIDPRQSAAVAAR